MNVIYFAKSRIFHTFLKKSFCRMSSDKIMSCTMTKVEICQKKPKLKEVTEKLFYTGDTVDGEKKSTEISLPEKYHPTYVEAKWYAWWEKSNFFSPEYNRSLDEIAKLGPKDKFTMIIPPPNVTGTLHLGHALMCAVQDALARFNRMKGKAVLWIPGSDHAGIATQVVVEKKLKRELNVSRHDIGRNSFVEHVWKWKEEKGHIIMDQMKRLGVSLDWSKSFFTMDTERSHAVTAAFVKLYDKGNIYRSKRLINWSCALKSAISDIEVDKVEINGRKMIQIPGYAHKIEFGLLVEFAYIIEGSGEKIVVATTRIETMLGDVAIAVHPKDTRYVDFVGKYVEHPFCSRKIKIIRDDSVDPNFGTGAVKITPAHDPCDYEIGVRHKLDMINIFDDEGNIVADLDFKNEYKCFVGIKRFDARKLVIQKLTALNLFVRSTDHKYVVPFCSRSGDVIEPLIKSQWFVNCSEMANRTAESVTSGDLKIYPVQYEKTWLQWMNNIQDWCISRQLWWGHRIPAYFVTSSKLPGANRDDGYYWVSAETYDAAVVLSAQKYSLHADELTLTQDEDVLDTWFSSGLLPLSALYWPNISKSFECFFPFTLLETGYDILFFWVARMVMLSLELFDSLPFKDILLHSIVRDSHGRKMSKSLGNIIDPNDVIDGISLEELQKKLLSYNLDPAEKTQAEKAQAKDFPGGIPECGSDALRFTLCAYSGSSKDINLDVLRIQGYRFFCNKIWNAARFTFSNFGQNFVPNNSYLSNKSQIDRWILSKLSSTVSKVNESFEKYELGESANLIHQFWLYDFCDVYIESLKPVFLGSDIEKIQAARQVLLVCIDNALRLLHPFMPFITEELYQRLPFTMEHFEKYPSISVSPYPFNLEWYDEHIEKTVESVFGTVTLIRSMKDNYASTRTKLPIYIRFHTPEMMDLFADFKVLLGTLVSASTVDFTVNPETIPNGTVISPYRDICDIHIGLRGVIDIPAEIKKNEAKLVKTSENLRKLKIKLDVEDYQNRVPLEIQDTNKAKLAAFECELTRLEDIINSLKVSL